MSDNLAAKEATSGRDAETLQQGGLLNWKLEGAVDELWISD
jgi:hypothetical protein